VLDPVGHQRGVARIDHPLEQDRELVAAQARDDVPPAHALLQPAGDGHEHLVAHMMPHAVVDQLEVVEVEEEHGEQAIPIAPRAERGIGQALHEERAVGEPGERVVQRVVPQLPLAHLALGKGVPQLQLGRSPLGQVAQQLEVLLTPEPRFVAQGEQRAEDGPIVSRERGQGEAANLEFGRCAAHRRVAPLIQDVVQRKDAAVVEGAGDEPRAHEDPGIVRDPRAGKAASTEGPAIGAEQGERRRRGAEDGDGEPRDPLHGRGQGPAEQGALSSRRGGRERGVGRDK
jgi:hypothetical protein